MGSMGLSPGRWGGLGGLGGRTCHSQALQLPQAQEGTGLHRADDIILQVPVGGKWGGPHTSPALGATLLPLDWVVSLPPEVLGPDFLLNPSSPQYWLGGWMKNRTLQPSCLT